MHHKGGCLYVKENKRIYLVGGWDEYNCEYFDLNLQKWVELPNTTYCHRYATLWQHGITNSLTNYLNLNNQTQININNDKTINILNNNSNKHPNLIFVAADDQFNQTTGRIEYIDIRDNCNKWNILSKMDLLQLIGKSNYFLPLQDLQDFRLHNVFIHQF